MKRACAAEVRPARQSLSARYAGQTVIAIGAHPDDLEIGLGGTLAKLKRDGARVIMVVASVRIGLTGAPSTTTKARGGV